jgi:C4-dicarboxylate transporter DctQ subunit
MMAPARLTRWLDRAEEAFMALALGLMTVLTFVQVILRYVFHASLVWSLEATSYLFGCLIAVGMAYGVRTHAHIMVDVLTRRLSPSWQRRVAGLALAASLGYAALMIYAGGVYVSGLFALGHRAQDIPLPRWVLASILPLGFGLLAVRLLQAGRRYFAPGRSDDGARR